MTARRENNMKNKQDNLKHEQDYVEFLKKRLESKHFKQNASAEEIEKTQYKYDKAKLKLRMIKGKI